MLAMHRSTALAFAMAPLALLCFLAMAAPVAGAEWRPTPADTSALEAALHDALPAGASAISLASGHLDGDGIADLVVGYQLPGGGGALALMRGRGALLFPRHAELAGSPGDGPFELVVVRTIERAPDWLALGDFDAADRADLAVASRDRDSLLWWPATGDFTFGAPKTLDLGGRPTTLVTGEIHRRDGLSDVAVAVAGEGPGGAELLLFQHPAGSLTAPPERFGLAAAAADVAVGRFDTDVHGDVMVAVGTTLHLVSGRDRKLSLPRTQRVDVPPSREQVFELGIELRSLEAGRFLGLPAQIDVAALTAAGDVLVWEEADGEGARLFDASGAVHSFDGERRLSSYPAASAPGNDTFRDLTAAGLGGSRHLLASSHSVVGWRADGMGLRSSHLEDFASAAPRAVLALRLDADGIDDLVILDDRSLSPRFLLSRGPAPPDFVVNSTDDADDGTCDAVHCSLREAILAANADPGPDVIGFAIGSGPVTIQVGTSLPPILETATLDATTQPGYAGTPLVELTGTAESRGLFLDADTLNGGVDNSMIRGFIINSFGDNAGVEVEGQHSYLEGNYIGTDASGLGRQGNAPAGVWIRGAGSSILVGGTAAPARNVISGNLSWGIRLSGVGNDNVIQGNFIGLGRDGLTPLGNGDIGVAVDAAQTLIGGGETGAGNVIGGDDDLAQRIGIWTSSAAAGSLIQGNLIGTDVTGLVARGNLFGIQGTLFTAGGAASGMANTISGNLSIGLTAFQGPVTLQGNRIGVGVDGVTPLGNGGAGARVNASGSLIGGVEPGQGNIVAHSEGPALDVNNHSGIPILGNSIYSNASSPAILNQVFRQAPILVTVESNATQTRLIGSFSESIPGEHRIEFFANPVCDSSGAGEGEIFLGATTVEADLDGAGHFSLFLPVSVPLDHVVTATNTLPGNTTSRFSRCQSVTALPSELMPELSIPTDLAAGPGSFVDVPVIFQSRGEAIATLAFELDFDQTCLGFDPQDEDADGLPDAVTLEGAAGFDVSVSFGADPEGELEIAVTQSAPLQPLPDGELLTLRLSTCSPAPGTSQLAAIDFTATPAPSFGDIAGQSVPGEASNGLVEVRSGLRGDCNGDGVVDAGDLAAGALEIFDGDGTFWLDVPGGTFAGQPVGCDANADTVVDAGDIVCTEFLIFGNSCAGPTRQGGGPRLSLGGPLGVASDGRVRVQLHFHGDGRNAILASAFTLDLGPGLVYVDGSLQVIQAAAARYFEVDAAAQDGEIDLLLATPAGGQPWEDGPLLELELEWVDPGLPSTWVRVIDSPALSFGSTNGAGLPHPATPPSATIFPNLLFGDDFESGATSRWSLSQP